MSTTAFYFKCEKCGYHYSQVSRGHIEDPIGMPIMRCPFCKTIYKDTKHKEWIQMSPLQKYFAISPRGNIVALFLAFIPMIFLLRVDMLDFIDEVPSALATPLFLLVLFVFWFFFDFLIVCSRVNEREFLDRVIKSLARTRNEEYKSLLLQFGKIYGENFPKLARITRYSKTVIEYGIKDKLSDEVTVPTFASSIQKH